MCELIAPDPISCLRVINSSCLKLCELLYCGLACELLFDFLQFTVRHLLVLPKLLVENGRVKALILPVAPNITWRYLTLAPGLSYLLSEQLHRIVCSLHVIEA